VNPGPLFQLEDHHDAVWLLAELRLHVAEQARGDQPADVPLHDVRIELAVLAGVDVFLDVVFLGEVISRQHDIDDQLPRRRHALLRLFARPWKRRLQALPASDHGPEREHGSRGESE
jgi:hypothetical protein